MGGLRSRRPEVARTIHTWQVLHNIRTVTKNIVVRLRDNSSSTISLELLLN